MITLVEGSEASVRFRVPIAATVALLTLASTGCLHHNARSTVPPHVVYRPSSAAPSAPIVQGEEGYASWYGHPYHGRRSASGEVYNMYDMTAAHRTLPFGMQVKVHDLENGRDVTVRINDRGPFVEGRIIDLSYAAAQAMGMNGIARVRLELLGMAPVPVPASVPGTVPTPEPSAIPVPGPAPIPVPAPAAIPAPSITTPTAIPSEVPGIFAVQVGSFSDLNNANRLKALIESSFTPVTVQSFDRGNGIVYRVQVGREATEARAEALAEKLRDSNLTNTTFVVRVN